MQYLLKRKGQLELGRGSRRDDSLSVNMTLIGLEHLRSLVIPQPDSRIENGGEEELGVGREGDVGPAPKKGQLGLGDGRRIDCT